jgi:nitrile hydratase
MLSDQRLVAAVHDVGPKVRYTAHDVGGVPELLDAPLPEEKPMQPWELECHALFAILSKDGILKTDMLRRAVESLPLHAHEEWGYYERWSAAMANLLREEGHLQPGQLEAELVADDDGATEESPPRFAPGVAVLVRREELRRTAWRAPHLRTPGYIFGCHGLIERHCGAFADPSLLAFGVRPVGQQHLYRVRFRQSDLWPEQPDELDDTVDV